MTIFEVSKKYNIHVKELQGYESWGLCGEAKKVIGSRHYDDSNIGRLGAIMTLHDIGFTNTEVERYIKLLLQKVYTVKRSGLKCRKQNQTERSMEFILRSGN